MIKIFSAKEQYRTDVINLWQEAFGDSTEYISFFLDNCPCYETVGYFVDNKIVSMFFMLEGNIDKFRCKYLYAACTSSEFRRQGIMENLIAFAAEHYNKNGYDSIFLAPANEKLYSYYQKLGFISSFRKQISESTINHPAVPQQTENYSVDQIVEIKLKLLNEIDCFMFDKSTLRYTVEEHLFNGGQIYCSTENNTFTLMFYYFNDDKLIIKEYLNSKKEVHFDYCKQIINNHAHNVYISYPLVYNNEDIVGEYTKCGMCLPLNSIFESYISVNPTLYAGMYLD